MGDRELLAKKLNEQFLFQPSPAGAMSFPIDDKFGAEAQEDGRIKIIEIVDGEQPREIGWYNPDGTSEIAGENGEINYYDSEGNWVGGMCVASEEDYFYFQSCDNCFTPNSDTAQLGQQTQCLAPAPPPTSHTEEPRTTNNNSHKHKLEKADLPERPVFEPRTTHQPAAATPPAIPVVTTSHSGVVSLSVAESSASQTSSTPHVTVSVQGAANVFGDESPSPVTAETRSDGSAPVAEDRSDASVGGAVLCFAPQSLQDGQPSAVVSEALPVALELCDPTIPARMQDETSPFAAGAFSAERVAAFTREGVSFDTSDASVGGEFFAVRGDSQPSRQGPAMAFVAEGAWVEGETIPAFIGWPFQPATRSESGALQATVMAMADSANQNIRNVDNQNRPQDQGNPDGNGGESGDNSDQDGQQQGQHQNPQDQEEE